MGPDPNNTSQECPLIRAGFSRYWAVAFVCTPKKLAQRIVKKFQTKQSHKRVHFFENARNDLSIAELFDHSQ